MRRVRLAIKLLLVLGLVLSTQSLLLVQAAFEVRQDFIAEHLCVNRDRPELNCNGHCVLAERHGDAQEQQREQGQTAHLEVLLSFSLLVPTRAAAVPPSARTHVYSQPPLLAPARGQRCGVFRPPQSA